MIETSAETKIAVLQVQLAAMEKASEERAKLQDARHEAVMSELKALRAEVTTDRHADEFRRGQMNGATGAVKAIWAVIGGTVVGGFAWVITRGA